MSNLSNSTKNSIINEYFLSNNTIQRYNVLHELEELIAELRSGTTVNNNMDQTDKANIALETIQSIFSWQSGCTLDAVKRVVLPDSRIDHVAEELRFDSLDMIELVMQLEEEFDMEIDDDSAESCKTIAEIINFVTR